MVPLYEELNKLALDLADGYDFEFVFTDNHSTDETFRIISDLASRDSRIVGYRFSKDFGFQRSILAGYLKSTGDAVVQIDADLQDPPDLIKVFISKWEEGFDVVYGIRETRQEGRLIGLARKAFYRLIDMLSEDELPHGAGDFRLVSRRVVDLVAEVDDYHPYLRGLIASLGFEQVGIEYAREARKRGETKFSFFRLLALAVDGILVHSVVPLRIATLVGIMTASIMVLAIAGYSLSRLVFGHEWPPGFATTTILLLLGIALNGVFLGIIGEYLGRLYQQVKRRPFPIIESDTIGNQPRTTARSVDFKPDSGGE